jgi:hypothetical protein
MKLKGNVSVGKNLCVNKGMKVWTKVVGVTNISKIKPGDSVLTSDGNYMEVIICNSSEDIRQVKISWVEKLKRKQNGKQCYKLYLENGDVLQTIGD